MRKSFIAILALILLVGALLFLKQPGSQRTSSENVPSGETSAPSVAGTDSHVSRLKWTKPVRTEAPLEQIAEPSNAIVYGSSDFARGELQNIVIDDGIRLGNDASFVPRFDPRFKIFGNFISPETDSGKPFDALSLNLQASALGENEVLFEIRTKSRFNEWSEWREVSPENMKEPISAETPKSTGWQFRITLFANDPAGSPKVETVSVEPLAVSAQNLSANNDTK